MPVALTVFAVWLVVAALAGIGPTCRDSCPPERTPGAVAAQRAVCEGSMYDFWARNAEAHPGDPMWWAYYGRGLMKARVVGPQAKAEFVERCLEDHFDG
ncbi:MAG: hypothetical protein LC792_21610 [Actinobacteria bacterium]|nr:hypothetical protein [Actinomycetota bacterium]